MAVFVRQRYWDRKDLWGASLIDERQEWYQLSHRVISIEVSESTDQYASGFNITFENVEGELAPDNYNNKWAEDTYWDGDPRITYARQFFPNNQVKVYLGYGEELIPFIHGHIGDITMSADGATLTVSCMTSYKHVIHQTIKEKEIKAPDGNLIDVLKVFFKAAGVVLHGEKIFIPGTTNEWIMKGIVGRNGQSYDEIVRGLIDTTFHYIRSNFDGSCTLMPVPRYMRDDPANVIIDQHVNLTNLDYSITDQDIYCAVTVTSGYASNRFQNDFLLNTVCLGKWREEFIDAPWADTYRKRQEVAMSHHAHNLHKWRTMNVGIMGDPRLQLWDRVGIREQISSQTWVFHIKGMQTMISSAGFVQVLDLSVNYGFATIPVSNVQPVQVFVDKLRLKLWDVDLQDGDELNVFLNNQVVSDSYVLKNTPTDFIDLSLELGANTIVIEGKKTPKGGIEADLQIQDDKGNVLFNTKDLPKVRFPRVNVNKSHYYTKRPAVTWNVTRMV